MIQRMNEVGGQCQVTSAVGCGCCVELTVPLAVASRLSKWFHRQTDSANEPVRPDNAQPISTKPEAESATSRTG
jgi:hypothetical protein